MTKKIVRTTEGKERAKERSGKTRALGALLGMREVASLQPPLRSSCRFAPPLTSVYFVVSQSVTSGADRNFSLGIDVNLTFIRERAERTSSRVLAWEGVIGLEPIERRGWGGVRGKGKWEQGSYFRSTHLGYRPI